MASSVNDTPVAVHACTAGAAAAAAAPEPAAARGVLQPYTARAGRRSRSLHVAGNGVAFQPKILGNVSSASWTAIHGAAQGPRPYMEDTAAISVNVAPAMGVEVPLFCMFDGHGGKAVSAELQCSFSPLYATLLQETKDPRSALERAFPDADRKIRDTMPAEWEAAGSTGVVVSELNGTVVCANAGDSRAVACVDGVAKPLSHDHKPSDPSEHQRIAAAGGKFHVKRSGAVYIVGRRRSVAVARGFGDGEFKEEGNPARHQIPATPEFCTVEMDEHLQYILLASDGVWDVMDNQEAVDFVNKHLDPRDPERVVEQLIQLCFRRGSKDNVSVVLALNAKDWTA